MQTFDKKSADHHQRKTTSQQEISPSADNDLPEFFNDLPQREQQSAILRLQQTRGNAHVLRQLQRFQQVSPKPTLSPAPRGMLQRYQAGEKGHGGIEERALPKAGFTGQEASAIYFGNWMRDFSQLNSSGKNSDPPDAFYLLIQILGWGEFNREVTRAELGTYVPSEHLDNPDAGGFKLPEDKQDKLTVEDPAIQALANLPDSDPRKKPFNEAFARLSPQQQQAYKDEEAQREKITQNATASGLPVYIERGKLHAKDELKKAIGQKRTPEGMATMGGALHAVEDYFSHSNFVDVGIWTLYNEGNTAAEPYVKEMIKKMHGTNPALVAGVDEKGQPKIVTGTYSPGANDEVSKLELLKAQLQTGEFAKAFVRGLLRTKMLTADEVAGQLGIVIGRAVGGKIGSFIGSVAGAVSGTVEGAQSGASEGYDQGSKEGYRSGNQEAGGGPAGEAMGAIEGVVEGAVGGFTGFFKGAVKGMQGGYKSGGKSGEKTGADIGGNAAENLNRAVMDENGELLLTDAQLEQLVASPLIQSRVAPFLATIGQMMTQSKDNTTGNSVGKKIGEAVDKAIDDESDKATQKSAEEAKLRKAGATGKGDEVGPTHSQIAKDAPDHPLFEVSVALAEEVDVNIGKAMAEAWSAGNTDDATVQPVTALVDKYVSDPSKDGWWRDVLAKKLTAPP